MAKKKTKKRSKQYFVKDFDGVLVVHDDYFDAIESRYEALGIAMCTYNELLSTQTREAVEQCGPLYIGRMNASTGFQRSLDELDRRFPFLLLELRQQPRMFEGHSRITIC